MTASGQGRGVAIVLGAAFFISINSVLAPQVYDSGSNPLTFHTLRFLSFVVICRLWFLVRGISIALPPRQRLTAYALGAVFSLGSGSLMAAFAYIPVSMAVLILYLYPLLTMIATCALESRRPRAIEALCLLTALLGLALALELSFTSLHPAGLGFALLSAFTMAGFVIWNGRALRGLEHGIASFHTAVGAVTVAAAATLATGSFRLEISGNHDWLIFACAMASFTIAFFFMFTGVRVAGPVRFATLMNMEPVITIGMAFFFLGENLSAVQMIGAALVIGAVVVAQRPQKSVELRN